MLQITRRDFVRVSTLSMAATVAAACTQPTAAPTSAPSGAAPQPTSIPPTQAPAVATGPTVVPTAIAAPTQVPEATSRFKEAPMLAELVEKGELPPVDERLPENPLVSPVLDGIGKYGGTWRRAFKGMSDNAGPHSIKQHGPLTFDERLSLRADICESWEVNEEGTVWTFKMRKGMRWSDGTPLTTADITWYWENIVQNETLTPTIPARWSTGTPKVLAEMGTPDDFSFTLTFAHPKPMFGYDMGWLGNPWVPRHYMEQFHPGFVEQAKLDAAAKAGGFNAWNEYYADRDNSRLNPERPTLDVWLSENPLSSEMYTMVRNPYFHQVDPEGQQLPYIDRMTHRLYDTQDVLNMWIMNGEIDKQSRGVTSTDFTLLKEGEDKGGYVVQTGLGAGHEGMQINQAPKNERLRPLFQNRNFRIAVSLAMNRQEMNEIVYDGMATPRQYSPIETSPQFYPKLSNAYIEYDPDEANRLLDEAGFTEKDAEGFRKWNDGSGETISFIIEGPREPGSPAEDCAQMAVKYLADVGLKAAYKYSERALYEERVNANETEIAYWGADRSVLPVYEHFQFTGTQNQRMWAGAWGIWKQNPEDPNAEEPPADHWIREIWRIYDEEILTEVDEQKRFSLFEQIMDIHAEEMPMVHFVGQQPTLTIVKNGFRGHLAPLTATYDFGYWLTHWAQQCYWDDPENHV